MVLKMVIPEKNNCDRLSNRFSKNSGIVVTFDLKYNGTKIVAAIINGIPDIHSYTEVAIPVEYAAPERPIIVLLEMLEANNERPINPHPNVLPPRNKSSPVLVFLAI
jgi:hypothetical protein